MEQPVEMQVVASDLGSFTLRPVQTDATLGVIHNGMAFHFKMTEEGFRQVPPPEPLGWWWETMFAIKGWFADVWDAVCGRGWRRAR